MFALEHHTKEGVFAVFTKNVNGEANAYIGTGRFPTLFLEHIAHEARSDFGLCNEFNIVKLKVER